MASKRGRSSKHRTCVVFGIKNEQQFRPRSGSLIFYDKTVTRQFRTDGYNWKKEGYSKLKLDDGKIIKRYSGTTLDNTMKRKIYTLCGQVEHIALVHYRETTGAGAGAGVGPSMQIPDHGFSGGAGAGAGPSMQIPDHGFSGLPIVNTDIDISDYGIPMVTGPSIPYPNLPHAEPTLRIIDITPVSGPIDKETKIMVLVAPSWHNLQYPSSVNLIIGDVQINAKPMNEFSLLCYAPRRDSPGEVLCFVSCGDGKHHSYPWPFKYTIRS